MKIRTKGTILGMIALAIFGMSVFAIVKTNVQPREEMGEVSYVLVDDKKVLVDVADTSQQRGRGLSGRESMANDRGMLFIFSRSGKYSFWMKDMNFALDFIWINGDKIVDVHKNIQPEVDDPPKQIYAPAFLVDKVLEVNAGWIEENFGAEDIVGKRVEFYTEN